MKPHDPSLGDPAELAALHAAGALTDAERATFEAHLTEGCPSCLAEMESYGPVTAALAAAVPPATPPEGMRTTLLRRVASASPLRPHVLALAPPDEAPVETILQRPTEGPWQETAVPGVQLRVLSLDRPGNRFTALVRMAPGAAYPRHVHNGAEECLVLEGELRVGDAVMRAGDYQHAPAGSAHGVQHTATGCLLFITSSLSDEFV